MIMSRFLRKKTELIENYARADLPQVLFVFQKKQDTAPRELPMPSLWKDPYSHSLPVSFAEEFLLEKFIHLKTIPLLDKKAFAIH